MNHRFALILLFVAPALGGCGGTKLAAVTGTVTLDGEPLPTGTITFETADSRPATGRIENGKIVEVTCFKPGDGAPVGSHKVAVTANAAPASAIAAHPGAGKSPGADYMTGKSLIHPAYNNPETSGLTVEITSGENTVNIKLKSKGP